MSAEPTKPPDAAQLRRHDFVVIPLLMIATLLSLALLGEVGSRQIFEESGAETCGMTGPVGVEVMRPNCISYRKAAEGPMTVNAYNDCGYRTPEPCRSRPADAIRVALMGSSTAQGLKVPYADTFAARLTKTLTQDCNRPVEFQNMGIPGATLLDMYRRTDEALAMHPDLVMLVVTPIEMRETIDPVRFANRNSPAAVVPSKATVDDPPGDPGASKSLVSWISDLAYNSRLLVAAQHFLFQDRTTFVKLYMLHGDDAGYLRVPYNQAWQQRLGTFDTLLGEMAARAKARGVPMMLVLGTARIQTALLDPSVRPPNVDPFALGRQLHAIADRRGVIFQDGLEGFATVSNPDDMYYAVDGHMDADGHAVLAHAILDRLLHSPGPFQGCSGTTHAGNQSAYQP
jgi:hypothetical protein